MTTRHVVVVGAGLSGLVAARELERVPDLVVTVVDGAGRAGGMVETEHWHGLVIDHGPEGFVTTKPEALEMVRDLGMEDDLVVGGPAPRQTFIVRDRTLRSLPYGILNPTRSAASNLLRSPLLTARGKARLALEPLVPRRRDSSDESVAAFVQRRFGSELLDRLVEPLIGGIHSGTTASLSAEMLLPALKGIEQQGKSVALRALRTSGGKRAGWLPPLVTLREGMGSLTDRLAAGVGDRLQLDAPVGAISRDGGGWWVRLLDGGDIAADGVVLAVPGAVAADLLSPHDDPLGEMVAGQPWSSSATVTLAWDRGLVANPELGTGFLVPASEGGPLAACTWTTAKWHHRSAEGGVMMRCFMRAQSATDSQLTDLAMAELRALMGLDVEPTRVIVRQRPAALPVMAIGHRAKVEEIHARVRRLGGLALAGAGLEGVGLPACVRSGRRAAEAVVAELYGTAVSMQGAPN